MVDHRDVDPAPIRRGAGNRAKRAAGKAGHVRQGGREPGQGPETRGGNGRMTSGSDRKGAAGPARVLTCAVYTRKSSEEGLEQDFNSLHAQREACEAYIASQRHEGWKGIITRYDDGGYSGGSMERPGLTRLLADIASGLIDIVVVYKVDRLTRALSDFARIVEIFDARGVSFVSVTQSFNTTTSMGRLTLNVLLSFAQFEREVTAERIRDKIAASKKKGIFMGGRVPMGYRVENRKLHIVEEEAQTIRTIFDVYLRTRSTIAAAAELTRMGITSKVQTPVRGKAKGGIPFTYGPLQWVLRNRIYVGEISHKGQHYPGEHEAIIDHRTFDAVQQLLTDQRSSPTRTRHRMRALLTGRIYDANGNRMAPSHSNKRGLRYRYYVSRALLDGAPDKAGKPSRIPATTIEDLVITALRKEREKREGDKRGSGVAWTRSTTPTPVSTNTQAPSGERAPHPTETVTSDQELVDTLLEHVEVFENRIVITLIDAEGEGNEKQNSGEGAESGRSLTSPHQIVVPCTLGQQSLLREVIASPANEASSSEHVLPNSQRRNRARLIDAIHRARGWFDELLTGKTATIEIIASREGRSTRNISMMLNLAFLAPEIIESILKDDVPATLSASHLAQNFPLDWEDQRRWIARQG